MLFTLVVFLPARFVKDFVFFSFFVFYWLIDFRRNLSCFRVLLLRRYDQKQFLCLAVCVYSAGKKLLYIFIMWLEFL